MVVTFFGDTDVPEAVRAELLDTIVFLIEKKKATLFFIGNDPHFDVLVCRTLDFLHSEYPHIRYRVLTPPADLHPAVAQREIDKRKRSMIKESETVITYVKALQGEAAKFKALALEQGKTVIELAK